MVNIIILINKQNLYYKYNFQMKVVKWIWFLHRTCQKKIMVRIKFFFANFVNLVYIKYTFLLFTCSTERVKVCLSTRKEIYSSESLQIRKFLLGTHNFFTIKNLKLIHKKFQTTKNIYGKKIRFLFKLGCRITTLWTHLDRISLRL